MASPGTVREDAGLTLLTSMTTTIETLRSEDVAKAQAYIEHLLIGKGEFPDTVLPSALEWPLPANVESMSCTRGYCDVSGPTDDEARKGITTFSDTARRLTPCTDKVCGAHSYQIMYGTHLVPLMQASSDAKIFEIGLGCNMGYGPGASVALWKELFPNANLWEAEYDADCVNKFQAEGRLAGINVVTGDQGDPAVVQDWIEKSGGDFAAVIDDGGHHNKQIRTSFEKLWPHVKPGGLYFLEDLQVGRVLPFVDDGSVAISDMVQAWVEQLLTQNPREDLPLPEGVQSIFCQAEACVLLKASDWISRVLR
jgi:hypothetical protein